MNNGHSPIGYLEAELPEVSAQVAAGGQPHGAGGEDQKKVLAGMLHFLFKNRQKSQFSHIKLYDTIFLIKN